jgi:hypothetical protein
MRDGPIPRQVLAIVFGASHFDRRLARGPAFYNSATDIMTYLVSPEGLGLPSDNILNLFDSTALPSDQLEEIRHFLNGRIADLKASGTSPTDFLMYYVGHGLFTAMGQSYHLAVRRTDLENESVTSIRMTDLANVVKHNAAFLRRYLILDCCYSATAYREFQSGPLQLAYARLCTEFPERGTTILCSSSAQDASLAPDGLKHTMFTDALLRALEFGHLNLGPRMSFSDIGDLIRESLREGYPTEWVRPEVHSPDQRHGDISTIPFFPNRAYRAHSEEDASRHSASIETAVTEHLKSLSSQEKRATDEARNPRGASEQSDIAREPHQPLTEWSLPEEAYILYADPRRGDLWPLLQDYGLGIAALADLSLRGRVSLEASIPPRILNTDNTGNVLLDKALGALPRLLDTQKDPSLWAWSEILNYEFVRDRLVKRGILERKSETRFIFFSTILYPLIENAQVLGIRYKFFDALDSSITPSDRIAALAALASCNAAPRHIPATSWKTIQDTAQKSKLGNVVNKLLTKISDRIAAEINSGGSSGWAD